MRRGLAFLSAAGGCLLLACATPPNRNLERAQSDYSAAAADPQVQNYAPTALRDAWTALSRAEQAERARQSREEVDHLAYLAARRVEIARVMALRSARAAVPSVVVVSPAPSAVQPAPVVRPVYPTTATASSAEARVEQLSAELAAALQDLRTRRVDRGVVVSVEDVLFEPGQATLSSPALADLARLADFLNRHPELSVQIEGHSDAGESDALSIERAQVVEAYLARRGVGPPARISTVAQGPYDPVASNATAAGRQQNRRVEIVLLD
jgi:outer membrane protein OmpA-like peptidoglycan-associated protein